MRIEDIKNEITLLFDMKEVSKRSIQFIGVGVIITGALVPVHIFDGHYLSAIITFIFFIFPRLRMADAQERSYQLHHCHQHTWH